MPEARRFLPVQDVTMELITEMSEGMHKDLVFQCDEGTEIPLSFLYNFDVFSVAINPNLSFKIQKSCYIRFFNGKPYISYELKEWKKVKFPMGEPKVELKRAANTNQMTVEATFTEETLKTTE